MTNFINLISPSSLFKFMSRNHIRKGRVPLYSSLENTPCSAPELGGGAPDAKPRAQLQDQRSGFWGLTTSPQSWGASDPVVPGLHPSGGRRGQPGSARSLPAHWPSGLEMAFSLPRASSLLSGNQPSLLAKCWLSWGACNLEYDF